MRRRLFRRLLVTTICSAVLVVLWCLCNTGKPGALSAAQTSETTSPHWEQPDVLAIPVVAAQSMQLRATAAQAANEARMLRLTGRLMYDPNVLVHVNTRFMGEVIRIGDEPELHRPLRAGDRVRAGQLLAVVWSREIGEKKSDLVEALSQMFLHETTYRNLKSLGESGAIAQRLINEMQRLYEQDLIQVERCRRTLRSWKITEADLAEVETEARRYHEEVQKPQAAGTEPALLQKIDATWAEIDLVSPLDGVILEKNLTVGDIVETSDELYKIADLSQLVVMANLFEDDLPLLLAIPPEQRTWQVRMPSIPNATPITGQIESVGNVIDPNQHTAVVQGRVDNADGALRIGQFLEVLVQLAPPAHEVVIPISALIDSGSKKEVLVALDPSLTRIQRRSIDVAHRTRTTVFLNSTGPRALRDGELVVTRGVLELSQVMDDLPAAVVAP